MLVSFRELKKMVNFPYSPQEITNILTNLGLEVRKVDTFGKLKNVVVGRILSIRNHPNADRLKIVEVNVGKRKISVVCGAPNVEEGRCVAVALEGAELPGGVMVKKVRIRGVDSPGMICSERELGLGEDHSGIMILPDNLSPGDDFSQALELEDTIFDLEIPSNRGDCLSILGIAREIAALLGEKIYFPSTEINKDCMIKADSLPKVQINTPNCLYYTARIIKGVKVDTSPFWLRRKIIISGGKPINNIVDVTNYVMWEMGQPLHSFDLETIKDQKIVVRQAKIEENLVTLDGKFRQLNPEMMVIADSEDPIALAGIMGGEKTEVKSSTCNILLEAAYFDPVSIRKTSRRIGLITEASSRFEKGIDPEMVKKALDRAALLIQKVAGGRIVDTVVEAGEVPKKRKKIYFRPLRVNRISGSRIASSTIEKILKNLGFQVKRGKNKKWIVEVPSFRHDIEREIDLVEEVCRFYGYDKVKTTLPSLGSWEEKEDKKEKIKNVLRAILKGCGFYEVITNSLVGEELLRISGCFKEEQVYIRNPLSLEQKILRPYLFPQLLDVASFNYNQEIKNLRIMEIGKVFKKKKDAFEEKMALAGVVVEKGFDFFSLKGIVEAILEEIQIDNVAFTFHSLPYFLSQESAFLEKNEMKLGYLGRLNPQLCEEFKLPCETYFFELDLDLILSFYEGKRYYQPLPKFPPVRRDISVVIKENVTAAQVKDVVFKKGKYIEEIRFFDVYRGANIPSGHKSLSFSIIFRHPHKTLTDDEVNKIQSIIIKSLKEKLGASLREK